MSIVLILGTRPEIIRMSPLIGGSARKGSRLLILHTGQHYSYETRSFLKSLFCLCQNVNLDFGSGDHSEIDWQR